MSSLPVNRRQVVRSLFLGSSMFPAVVKQLMADEGHPAGADLKPRSPHFPAPAKRVIFIYLSGGASHVDSFDPKPVLAEYAKNGKTDSQGRTMVAPQWAWKPRGQCGTEVTDLFPNIAECADDLAVVRSMRNDHNNHFEATLGIHTGSVAFKRPSIGSWASYGLGTENQNLPCYVVLAPEIPYAGSQIWSSNFLPGVFSGTRIVPGPEPVQDLNRRAPSMELQRQQLSLLERFNRKHQSQHPGNPMLEARIKSYETAFGMQMEMPKVLDISKESDATLRLYGMDRGTTSGFGWQCLVARRMAESGVRFIELIDTGASKNWDAHGDVRTHEPLARKIDRPIAGLLTDLKSRGMLKDTLVVFTTEFGRSPYLEGSGKYGRGHYNSAFSSWLAGGGVKGGTVYGSTDELGENITEKECHVHDFHATILHCLGFDHTKLTFRHAGRDYRLTDVGGRVVQEILA